jgi:alkanesulfonate monooxygenase SsuD/methylene tetrahydromethanopterin reductase-like flavin-dependent oxidoreductase (luciferase family)
MAWMCARAARTLAGLFDGRFILGLGVSHQKFVDRYGLHYEKPYQFMRAYLARMKAAPYMAPAPAEEAPVVRVRDLGGDVEEGSWKEDAVLDDADRAGQSGRLPLTRIEYVGKDDVRCRPPPSATATMAASMSWTYRSETPVPARCR